jgi:hypothetical protein
MKEQSSGGGGGSNQLLSKHYCLDEVEKTITEMRDRLRTLAEKVCLAYLDEPSVKEQFKAHTTAAVGAASSTGRTVSRDQENTYYTTLASAIESRIKSFLASSSLTENTIFLFEKSILTDFVNSQLFKYFDSINSIEKLKRRVKKIDD